MIKSDELFLRGLLVMIAFVILIFTALLCVVSFEIWKKHYPCQVPVQWMSFNDMQRCGQSRGFEVDAI